MVLLSTAHGGHTPKARFIFSMRLVELHLKHADAANKPWLDEVVRGILAPLKRLLDTQPDDQFVLQIVDRLLADGDDVRTWLCAVLRSQCAPVLELLRPAMDTLMKSPCIMSGLPEVYYCLSDAYAWSPDQGAPWG